VKPGIVDWAQVNDRCGETGEAQRIELDLRYIENCSLLFDIKIIVMTLFSNRYLL
jgi:putative colanic acid biosynthesis UDP-glucose lipid carrier transferase